MAHFADHAGAHDSPAETPLSALALEAVLAAAAGDRLLLRQSPARYRHMHARAATR
jgi:hypothetical protein